MKLARAIEEYVKHKRSLGMVFKGNTVRLTAFLNQVGNVEVQSYYCGTSSSVSVDGWPGE